MSQNLYSITEKYREVLEEIEELEGEMTPEIDAALTIVQEDLEDKLYAYHSIIQKSKATNEMVKDEINRLNLIIQRNNDLKEKLAGKVLDACFEFGYDGKSGNKKIDLDTLKVYTRKTDTVLLADEESFVNSEFVTVGVKVPNDDNIIKTVIDTIIKMSPDKEYASTLNVELKKTISKRKVLAALKLNRTIKGASILTKHSAIMK